MARTVKAFGVAALVAGAVALPVAARANLVQNGGFEDLTGAPNQFIGYGVSELVGWSYGAAPHPNAAVYTFAGANSFPGAHQTGPGFFPLYGPGTGYNNGFSASPAGGNFLASDGEPLFQGAINQTITGLTPGDTYVLHFVWAGNQFLDSTSQPYHGNLTIDWQVSLGAETLTTPVVTYVAHDFTGWMTQTFAYTATSSSELLSFLAQGGPNGLPPTALLDGVSLTAPEPASWSVMIMGLVGLGALVRRHRRAASAS
jgi:MYXO-CTERM domain-containing protein